MPVYLDYNATTPVNAQVQRKIMSVLENEWANPSSSYSIGKEAKETVESARKQVADMIGATPEEIIFTSGGTESNNMVIQTILQDYSENESTANSKENDIPHIITTNIEHDAIKLPLEALAREGKASVSFVPVEKDSGALNMRTLLREIRPNTRLITVMLANNETGVLQQVSLIKKCIRSFKNNQTIFIHTDAAQAIGKINVNVTELDVDYLTIVGHKFYGPRIGALYFRKSCPLYPVFYGGGQERGYRPGTENTCMIAGLGLASELVTFNLKEYNLHMKKIEKYLENTLEREFSDKVIFNFSQLYYETRLPNTLSVMFNFDDITGKMILNQAVHVFASTGAACHSGGEASAILIASGLSEIAASKTIRLSVGRETTEKDIDKAVQHLKDAIHSLAQNLY